MPALRRGLPGQRQEGSLTQGFEYASTVALAREWARELGFLPEAAGGAEEQWPELWLGQECAVASALIRVFRRLRRLRRNALYQTADAIVWRSGDNRERYRLFEHLRRQLADDSVHDESRGPGTRVEQFVV